MASRDKPLVDEDISEDEEIEPLYGRSKSKNKNGKVACWLGVIALALKIISIFVPLLFFASLAALVLAVIGVIYAIIGLVHLKKDPKQESMKLLILGLALCAAALVLVFVIRARGFGFGFGFGHYHYPYNGTT